MDPVATLPVTYHPPQRSAMGLSWSVDERRRAGNQRAGVAGIYRSHQHARNAAGARSNVALRTIQLGALKYGLVDLVFIQKIENGPLARVEGDQFDGLAVVHLAHVDVIVVIEGTGMVRRDLSGTGSWSSRRPVSGDSRGTSAARAPTSDTPDPNPRSAGRTRFDLVFEFRHRIGHVIRADS